MVYVDRVSKRPYIEPVPRDRLSASTGQSCCVVFGLSARLSLCAARFGLRRHALTRARHQRIFRRETGGLYPCREDGTSCAS